MMMQSNLMSAVIFSNPKIGEPAAQIPTRTAGQSDDTFMNMLNDRLQARAEDVRYRPAQKTELSSGKGMKDVTKNTDSKATAQTGMIRKTNQPSESTPETKKTTTENSTPDSAPIKEEAEKTLSTLENLVALLEELLAKLQVKTVEVEPAENTSQPQAIMEAEKEIHPAELLKALLEGNTEKLKSLLGTMKGSEKTSEFEDLLKSIEELVQKLTANQEEESPLFQLSIESVKEGTSKEELTAQLKEQISGMIDKLKSRINELRQSLEQSSESQSVEDIPMVPVETEDIGQSLTETPKEKTENKKDTEIEKKDKGAYEKPVHLHAEHNQTHNAPTLKEATLPEAMVMNNDKPLSIQPDKIVKNTVPLTEKPLSQAITNQVMMKVKLMSGENKQEMEMQLKPESLGKLSLKIIHERGEVLAKITAENEQVKGVLDSNMQLLKDALEKNGFTVQSLSVSVGNGNSEGKANRDFQGFGRSGSEKREGIPSGAKASDNLYTQSRLTRDYYEESPNIDLTA